MQPLDVSYFKALKTAYDAAADSWMVTNIGKRITFFDIAAIFGKAYLRTATPEKAVNGFAKCGIWPFDENIFSDADFATAEALANLDGNFDYVTIGPEQEREIGKNNQSQKIGTPNDAISDCISMPEGSEPIQPGSEKTAMRLPNLNQPLHNQVLARILVLQV